MIFPIRAAIIVPKGYPLPANPSAIKGRVTNWLSRMQQYVKQETGATFEYVLYYLESKYDHLELATERRRDGDVIIHLDAQGRGIDEGQIWNKCFREELALGSEMPGENVFRWTAFVFGAGGWAGGRHNSQNPAHPLDDFGQALIGDWNIVSNVGKHITDPTCEAIYGKDSPVCTANGDGWSHEMLHLFNVECHTPNTYPFAGNGLNIDQKDQLISFNKRFLKDA